MAINTVGELIDALEQYPAEDYVGLVVREPNGGGLAASIGRVYTLNGIVYVTQAFTASLTQADIDMVNAATSYSTNGDEVRASFEDDE